MTDDKSRFDDWARLAAKELKDTPVESLTRDYGGIPVRPIYFPEDARDAGVPGVAPFTRGVRATMYANRPATPAGVDASAASASPE